jgi:DNA-binding NtrC family response regulator
MVTKDSEDTLWRDYIVELLQEMGEVKFCKEQEIMHFLQAPCSKLIVIDENAVRDVNALIVHIRDRCADSLILVATASPTWRRAREAFHAGATDYVHKSVDRVEIQALLEALLMKKHKPGRDRKDHQNNQASH